MLKDKGEHYLVGKIECAVKFDDNRPAVRKFSIGVDERVCAGKIPEREGALPTNRVITFIARKVD